LPKASTSSVRPFPFSTRKFATNTTTRYPDHDGAHNSH
jgi:hypothetical protein